MKKNDPDTHTELASFQFFVTNFPRGGTPRTSDGFIQSAIMAGPLSALTPAEISHLSQYLFDGLTQQEIANLEGMSQTAISYRIRRAARKLEKNGVDVKRPGRGRRAKAKTATIEPSALDRLVITADATGRRGRWIESMKIVRDH